ncbi:hypothetical protein ElyMa_000589500 [Elysia marginata]|uniref:Uncharacterized protein n=1 Tax=Elysia marginata TaxID=1093978 RepID=A0AAV4G5S8_9GAST|nr:hypothetical protein ElyMa_000589500 [Elysia marginata]
MLQSTTAPAPAATATTTTSAPTSLQTSAELATSFPGVKELPSGDCHDEAAAVDLCRVCRRRCGGCCSGTD